MRPIKRYLKNSVDIVSVTMTKGVRSTDTTIGVSAYVTSTIKVDRSAGAGGDIYERKDLIFFAGDVTIEEKDEIIVGSVTRKIDYIRIWKSLHNVIHHKEVVLI